MIDVTPTAASVCVCVCVPLPQSVASKLHGVEVEIKVIKRKGDPLYDTVDPSTGAAIEPSTPANDMVAAAAVATPASACPQHHQQTSKQHIPDGSSCRENRDDNKLLANNINNTNILSNSNMNSCNSISNSQGNLSCSLCVRLLFSLYFPVCVSLCLCVPWLVCMCVLTRLWF